VACPLCELRKPKRYCPAKAEMICADCCGEKREVTIDCPSDCSYLIASRRWEREHRKPITVADVPYPDLSIPMGLIHEQQPLISGVGYTVLKAASEFPSNCPDPVESRFTSALFYRAFTQNLNPLLTLNVHLCARWAGAVPGKSVLWK